MSDVQIANVVTDVFGKTPQSILKLMLANPKLAIEDITPLLRKNLKSLPKEILKSIDGNFDESQSPKMNIVLKHYDSINECINGLEGQIFKLAIQYSTEINLLLTVPGIKEISAIFTIVEIGTNMNTFIDDKHLCSWAGLTPRCNESARKKKSVRITKAGIYIKPLLVQRALCVIKDKSCPYIKDRYESLKRRRGHEKATIVIARVLLTSIYHILLTGEVFDYQKFENLIERNFEIHKNIQNTSEDVISYLTNLGYSIILQNT